MSHHSEVVRRARPSSSVSHYPMRTAPQGSLILCRPPTREPSIDRRVHYLPSPLTDVQAHLIDSVQGRRRTIRSVVLRRRAHWSRTHRRLPTPGDTPCPSCVGYSRPCARRLNNPFAVTFVGRPTDIAGLSAGCWRSNRTVGGVAAADTVDQTQELRPGGDVSRPTDNALRLGRERDHPCNGRQRCLLGHRLKRSLRRRGRAFVPAW